MLQTWKIVLFCFQLVFLTACSTKKAPTPPKSQQETLKMEVDAQGLSKVKAILKTVHGEITIKFYPQKAPITVARITELIQSKFYNGVTFHRVVPNFVVQGGDPSGTGSNGSGQTLPAEFNDIPHVKGAVAMARKRDTNSADSQFYIALSRLKHLDGKYTVFGQVTEGLEVVDRIRKGDKMISFTIIH